MLEVHALVLHISVCMLPVTVRSTNAKFEPVSVSVLCPEAGALTGLITEGSAASNVKREASVPP